MAKGLKEPRTEIVRVVLGSYPAALVRKQVFPQDSQKISTAAGHEPKSCLAGKLKLGDHNDKQAQLHPNNALNNNNGQTPESRRAHSQYPPST